MGFHLFMSILPFPRQLGLYTPAHLLQGTSPYLLQRTWHGTDESRWAQGAALTQIPSFLVRTWNNRWGKIQDQSPLCISFHFCAVIELMLLYAMKGQIKSHFSVLSILFLFSNYLSLYCIVATDGTLKVNSLLGNCILCSLFLPSKMTM